MQHSCPAATASFAQTGAADTLVAYNHNGKWGFVGRHAADVTFVIEPAYEMAYPFYEGRAAVRKDNLWGFIDATGKLLIPYQFFCCEKLPFLQRPCRSKKKVMVYGVIDAAGKTIMPFTFTETWLYPNQQVHRGFFNRS